MNYEMIVNQFQKFLDRQKKEEKNRKHTHSKGIRRGGMEKVRKVNKWFAASSHKYV